MSNPFTKSVGIASVAVLFSIGANAQTTVMLSQAGQSAKSSVSSLFSKSSSEIPGSTDKLKAESKSDSSTESPTEPRLPLKNPQIEFNVSPSTSKMARAFEAPSDDAMGETMSFRATAYSLTGRTRLGTQVRRGVIAADPRVLPLGSVVRIKSGDYSGVYTVHDTGGRIKGNIVDVWVPTRHEARQFGRRSIKVNVLRLGPTSRRTR